MLKEQKGSNLAGTQNVIKIQKPEVRNITHRFSRRGKNIYLFFIGVIVHFLFKNNGVPEILWMQRENGEVKESKKQVRDQGKGSGSPSERSEAAKQQPQCRSPEPNTRPGLVSSTPPLLSTATQLELSSVMQKETLWCVREVISAWKSPYPRLPRTVQGIIWISVRVQSWATEGKIQLRFYLHFSVQELHPPQCCPVFNIRTAALFSLSWTGVLLSHN